MNRNILILALLLAGCAAGPDYARPKVELPENLSASTTSAQPDATKVDANPTATAPDKRHKTGEAGEQWWKLFADPVLDKLEAEALAHNASVQMAVANVLAARAQLGLADADRYPVVSAGANQSRTKFSQTSGFPRPTTNLTRLTLNASYELDLWGRYRRGSEAANAELLSAEAARDAATLSLSAQVAQSYFALLALDAQERVLQRALAGRQEMIALDRKKVEVGVMSSYDMHQAEADEAAMRSQLATLAMTRDRQEAALAVLLGRQPREVMTGAIERGTPTLAGVWVPEGLPSELLLRRPDLRSAEMHLVALNAQIGVARSQYFPSLTLTGYLGRESSTLSKLFTGPSSIFQFAANVTQPIFNAGRTGYLVDVAQANRDKALAQYQQVVANAFADVRNALSAQDASQQSLAAETARSTALAEALRQSGLRYKIGVSSRLEVLDIEKNFLLAELGRVEAERAQRSAVADLFKALGGAWQGDGREQGQKPAPAENPAQPDQTAAAKDGRVRNGSPARY